MNLSALESEILEWFLKRKPELSRADFDVRVNWRECHAGEMHTYLLPYDVLAVDPPDRSHERPMNGPAITSPYFPKLEGSSLALWRGRPVLITYWEVGDDDLGKDVADFELSDEPFKPKPAEGVFAFASTIEGYEPPEEWFRWVERDHRGWMLESWTTGLVIEPPR
jgi:hypothetical protein